MNQKKNILIGKLGKCVKFKNIDISLGGDSLVILYSTLSRMNPEYNFYFIGPNDLNKLTQEEYEHLFPNKNVYSAYFVDKSHLHKFDVIVDYFKKNNIVPDFGLIFNGITSACCNIENFLKDENGNYKKTLMAYSNYAGPYFYTLNELDTPYYIIAEDPRYITVAGNDLYNHERLVFTQVNGEFETRMHITSKDDMTRIRTKIKGIYAGIEKIFMMGLPNDWRERIDIDHKLMSPKENHVIVISHGHCASKIDRPGHYKTHTSRIKGFKEYIIDNLKNTEYANTKIYGKWDKHFYDDYPQIQNKKLVELVDEINDAKYSFIYSIIPGFVTVKAWEMITLGLIPFMHPDYDKDHLLGLPEYLYLKSPQDLLDKIKYLDEHDDEYKKLLNECLDSIKEYYMNGEYLNNLIFSTIGDDLGFEYEHKDGVKTIINRYNI